VPSGSPPRELVIKDLKRGDGPAVPPISNTAKVKIAALYNAVDLETGEVYEERWNPRDPYETKFDASLNPSWERGLEGMKAGGRRMLIVPASMSFPHELPLAYVIDLLRVEKLGAETAAMIE